MYERDREAIITVLLADPSFYRPYVLSPIPTALCNPGMADVVHLVCGGPQAAPGSWWPPLA